VLSDRCMPDCAPVCLSCNVGVLWPNGWMDQNATWQAYGDRHRPTPHCVRWRPSSRGTAPPPISAHVYCGKAAGWIKMPLGMQVGLSTGHIVLDGEPALPSPKGAQQPPHFGPCLLWPNSWMDQDATWCGGRPRRHCVRWGPSSPTESGTVALHFSAHVHCGQTVAHLSKC